ncbi:hypothetical protein RvY_10558 [Ramazzottius varieornatus]|uniref:DOMON domain-containing protein n=1 Tax=Ramazzottius varieornatus TaxID=947166 RepID=A0A1D1VD51_RAMVA|nr:hypothetical protein RvY_10558 [Ramazzottius varieornatus]
MKLRRSSLLSSSGKLSDFSVISLVICILPPLLCNGQGPVANFPVGDCNVAKQCVGWPEPTCVSQGLCSELVKWTYNPSYPAKVKFDLYGVPPIAGSTNFWIAFGLNHVTGAMAGTLVNECVYNNGAVDVFSSYNSDNGYINRRIPGQEKLGVSDPTGAYSNGILSCSFSLDRVRDVNGKSFDLASPLFVVLGDGPALQWSIKPHMMNPFTSSQAYTIASENQPTHSYPNLQSLNTVAPTNAAVGHFFSTENSSGESNKQLQDRSSSLQSSGPSVMPATIEGCGVTKGCLATPSNCLNAGNCQAILTYQKDADRSGEFRFELWRTMTSPNDQYVAMGLNPTSPSMPGTGVVSCVSYGNTVDVISSYNPSYYSVPTDNSKEGITVLQAGKDGSHLYCQFSMQPKKSFRGSFANSPVEVDLSHQQYLVLAYGPARPTGAVGKHSVRPLASAAPVALANVAVAASANNDMRKAHGGLMVAAWMFLASIGIFTARYYKDMWLQYQPCGLKLWFHIHRPVMVSVVSITIAAIVIIFVEVGGWTQTPAQLNPHPIIGIIAFVLALIQPIMAFFRPHPGEPKRWIFNWAHFSVGFAAHSMAIAAIFLGLQMPQLSVDYSSLWIMVAFSAFHVLWLVLAQLVDWIAPCVTKTKQTTIQMKTTAGNGVIYEDTVVHEKNPANPASTVKTIMWWTHVLVVAGLTIAILVLIGISP